MACQCPPHSRSDMLVSSGKLMISNTLTDLFADSLASANLTDSFVLAQSVLNNKDLSSACTHVSPISPTVGSRTPTFKPIYVDRGSSPFRLVDIGNEDNEK
jgi:hypothetical protein